jgi:hypothetical protein
MRDKEMRRRLRAMDDDTLLQEYKLATRPEMVGEIVGERIALFCEYEAKRRGKVFYRSPEWDSRRN